MLLLSTARDYDCRCQCCSPHLVSNFLPDAADAIHEWDAETWPHPYTVDTEVFGGAVVNSYAIEEGPPAEYFTPLIPGGAFLPTGAKSLRLSVDITAPSGRWDAWLIFWMPASNIAIEEVLDVTTPEGIVTLLDIDGGVTARLQEMSRNVADGPFPVYGLVVEYDSVRYYTPHPYVTDKPFCWRSIINQNQGEWLNSGTLNYSGKPITYGCKPSPATLDRVGLVVGLTTVAEDPADDRTATGNITATFGLDNIYAVANYGVNCPCWFADPSLTTLTATFELAPTEILGETLTLTRSAVGNPFTASGTYGPDSLPYTLTYTPCVSLLLELSDCDEIENPNYPDLALTFLHQNQTYDPFNNYQDSSIWEPINILYTNRVCYEPPPTIGNGLPDCGLTFNTTLPVGSPPFIKIWQCLYFHIRLEE